MPYIWIGIILFAAIAEVYTFVFVSVWCIPSAATAFILSLTGFHVWIQVAVFFVMTFILLVLSRTIFGNFIKSKTVGSNSVIGKTAIVTKEINNYQNSGTIRVGSLEYNAKSDDDDIIYETGLIVTIIRADGIYAICSR